jgi:hypothetical protein
LGVADQQANQTEAETDKSLEAKVAQLVDYFLNDGTLEEEDKAEDRNVAISSQVLVELAAWAGKCFVNLEMLVK